MATEWAKFGTKKRERVEEIKARQSELKAEMGELESEKQTVCLEIQKTYNTLNKNPLIPLEPIKEEMDQVDEDRKKVEANMAKRDVANSIEDANEEARGHTETIKAKEAEKAELLADSNMPVEGLAIGDDCVLFNGVPLKQVNLGAQIEIGAAILISTNPQLKFMSADGNGLDSAAKARLDALGRKYGYIIFLEETADEAGYGFYIEDGEAK